jgi:type III secretion protein J
MRARSLAVSLVVASLLLGGCGQDVLYSQLSERDANEMIAVLKGAGREAGKSTRDGKTWSLTAPRTDFADDLALLEARGYPKDRFQDLGEVFRKQGFVSSPVEEHARLVFGMSQELESSISNIDGVVAARVHIALPETDPLTDVRKPASASVLIKYDPQVDLTSQVGAIRQLVSGSVEDLSYDHVTVLLTPARAPPPRRPGAGPATANVAAGALAILAALAAAGAGRVLWRRTARPDAGSTAP